MVEPATTNAAHKVLHGTPHVSCSATGIFLASSLELSFWGGVDHATGEVVDRYHPLSRQYLKDKVLAVPGGRGSCSGSATILELIMNGNGPKVLIFERTNEILAVGVFIAEEVFQKTIPMVVLSHEDYKALLGWNGRQVHIQDHQISVSPLEPGTINYDSDLVSPRLYRPDLSDADELMLRGGGNDDSNHSKAQALAMRIIVRTASIMKARDLMSITQAHVDGAHFGPASVLFGKQLRDLGGRFVVPTTINALTIDQRRWRDLGVDLTFGVERDDLAQAFLDMGAQMSFTCAPYQLDSAPKLGDQVAFGESNVVCYANIVRTAKYPNMLEALIALTGRAPRAGIHLPENRSMKPLPSRDSLKAFSAAFATSAGAPMFHMLGITPEAKQYDKTNTFNTPQLRFDIKWEDVQHTWKEFNQISSQSTTLRTIDLVSLGNPHFSLLEIKTLAHLCRGNTKHANTSVIVTTSRAQHSLATQAGYIAQLEDFGVQVLTDTCWCFIRDPVIKPNVNRIMTNSGKYAHYGPGLTGREFCFGGLEACVHAACTGQWSGVMPGWLQTVVTNTS
ncbi:hypothetical protein EJ07DRAFT_163299 [Lizonia empirigonia]|nr:hypothetical protein EJ07DRAFT_163299 [Lizonia empirigonia]